MARTRCASSPRPAGSPSSSTASRAAASPLTTRSSSRARGARRSRAPTSRWSSACRWTSASASASPSGRRRTSSRSTSRSPSATTRGRWRTSSTATCRPSSPRLRRGGGGGARAVRAVLSALAAGRGGSTARWVEEIRGVEREKREAERELRADSRAPLHPMRLYAELGDVIDRNAIVIGDGGDFVSYAGRLIDSYEPGCWLDPGPFGCLGSGPGYALAAKLARPDRQVVLLSGDGAFGFSGMEYDTLARHGVDVVGVMGNNGIWALEKHPMEFLYGYSVAAELRPETRYDRVVEALGGHGALVREPGELRGALETAFTAGKPALVNVLTDPSVAYPRSSNLA